MRTILLFTIASIIQLCFTGKLRGQSLSRSIILLYSDGNFSRYTNEILRTEGFRDIEMHNIGRIRLSASKLRSADVVIVATQQLSMLQVNVLRQYVNDGGNLVSILPHTSLAPIFGLGAREGIGNLAYMSIDDTQVIGTVTSHRTFRIHVPVEKYALQGGQAIATALESRVSNTSQRPLVVMHKYGRGKAIAFLYDLPRNVAYTRQGNPALATKETDGIPGIRAMDLFTSNWVDTADNTLNHADEQMRLLTKVIDYLSGSRKPLPRLWYFPAGLKTLVTLNNDGEDSREEEFEPQFADVHAKGAKMTLYIKETHLVSKTFTDKWQQRGFEISGHPDHTKEATSPRWHAMDSIYEELNRRLNGAYGVQNMKTVTNHWFVWCGAHADGRRDFAAQAKLEEKHGIGLDCNYAHYDNNSSQGHFLGVSGYGQGNYTGSGLVMKFADVNGNAVDVYQQLNNVYDQQYMEQKDKEGYFNAFKGLLDRSIDNETYSFISVRAHNNEYFFSKEPLMQMLDYANSRKVPVWSQLMLLEYLRSREDAEFDDMKWKDNVLSFTIKSRVEAAHDLTCMIPAKFQEKSIEAVMLNGKQYPVKIESIKGQSFVLILIEPGHTHRISAEYGR